jgi:hypothetical protein
VVQKVSILDVITLHLLLSYCFFAKHKALVVDHRSLGELIFSTDMVGRPVLMVISYDYPIQCAGRSVTINLDTHGDLGYCPAGKAPLGIW